MPNLTDKILDPAKLRRRRIERGLSKTRLAELVGVSVATVSYLESSDRNPSPNTLRRLAIALECETADLMPPVNAPVGG